MNRALLAAIMLLSSCAAHAQQPTASSILASVMPFRDQLLTIYGTSRAKCLHPQDAVMDYCALAKAQLDAIQQLDREIVEAQRPQQQTGRR
jgi:hypothetical protein